MEGRSTFTAVGYAGSETYYLSEVTHGRFSAKSDVYSYGVVSYIRVLIIGSTVHGVVYIFVWLCWRLTWALKRTLKTDLTGNLYVQSFL